MYRDDLLRAAAAAKRKTIADLVLETKLNKNTISDILDGKERNYGVQTLEKVADALDVSLSELYAEPAAAV